MTTKTAIEIIGKEADLYLDGLTIKVKIVDARYVFGRDDVQVQPLAGCGVKWVSRDSINLKAQ